MDGQHRGGADRGGGAVTRVLVADHQALFRRGLIAVLGADWRTEVVGEAGNGEDAVALAVALEPDVVVLDVALPGPGGVEAVRRIRGLTTSTRVLVLTASVDEQDLYEAVKAGATGYLLKDLPAEEVVDAVRAAAAGQSLIAPSLASKLLGEFNSLARAAARREPGSAPVLTARELEVLALLARGRSNREVGAELFISENTAKNHVRNILEKLHLHSRVEAVMHAVRLGLVDPYETGGGGHPGVDREAPGATGTMGP